MNIYASRKSPASLKHFTFVDAGNKALNSSQWIIEARPPAEQPESSACRKKRVKNDKMDKL